MKPLLSKPIYVVRRSINIEIDLFSVSITAQSLSSGTQVSDMPTELPKIIAINIIADNICDDNEDYLQPVKLLFTKPPYHVAFDNLVIYNIQLRRFKNTQPDWNNNLDCWLYILNTARLKKLAIQEVIDMTPEINHFIENDDGFRQFDERYRQALGDPEIRREYAMWVNELMRERGRLEAALLEFAKILLIMGIGTLEQISEASKLPIAEIVELRDKLNLQ
jgi:hypothetical protein